VGDGIFIEKVDGIRPRSTPREVMGSLIVYEGETIWKVFVTPGSHAFEVGLMDTNYGIAFFSTKPLAVWLSAEAGKSYSIRYRWVSADTWAPFVVDSETGQEIDASRSTDDPLDSNEESSAQP
jgi:hypothetical protein